MEVEEGGRAGEGKIRSGRETAAKAGRCGRWKEKKKRGGLAEEKG